MCCFPTSISQGVVRLSFLPELAFPYDPPLQLSACAHDPFIRPSLPTALTETAPKAKSAVILIPCLIFARLLSALVLATSFVPSRTISWRFRLAVALVLTVLVSPAMFANSQTVAGGEGPIFASFAGEILRGACFGFGLCLWLIGAEICATMWGHLSGISIDAFPTGDQRPWARFFQLTWLTVFFLTGAHRIAVRALLDSFHRVPPGSPVEVSVMLHSVLELLGFAMQLGLRAGIPLAATLLAALGITVLMSRLLPHLQTLVTSTSLGALMLVAALFVGWGPLAQTLQIQVSSFLTTWVHQLSAVGN